MSLHYILDGYNLIKNSELSRANKLKDQRDALFKFIEEKRPQGSANNKVTVVFDGRQDAHLDFTKSKTLSIRPRVEIIFTLNETADDRIKKIVSGSKNPKNMVVVSDDREIQFFIRSCGAHSIKVGEFLGRAKGKKRAQSSLKVELSYSQAQKINQELKKIWLR